MIAIFGHPISIMVTYAIVLHLCWAVILVFDHSALNATAVNALHRYIESPGVLAMVITAAACAAAVGLWVRIAWLALLLLLGQQVLLLMSAAGAIEAIWNSQFADGVVRSRGFIAADQLYSVLAAIGHTIAITLHTIRIGR